MILYMDYFVQYRYLRQHFLHGKNFGSKSKSPSTTILILFKFSQYRTWRIHNSHILKIINYINRLHGSTRIEIRLIKTNSLLMILHDCSMCLHVVWKTKREQLLRNQFSIQRELLNDSPFFSDALSWKEGEYSALWHYTSSRTSVPSFIRSRNCSKIYVNEGKNG